MEQNVIQPAFDDEVDLFELFETVWEGKWLIALVVAIGIFCGGVYVFLFPAKYKGTFEIKPQTAEYISVFAPLNSIAGVSKPIAAGSNIVGYEEIINAKSLLEDFVFNFLNYEAIRVAVENGSKAYKEFDGEKAERLRFRNRIAKQFKINAPGKNETYHTVSFETYNKVEAEKILASAFQQINEQVRLGNLDRIKNLSSSIATTLKNEIIRIENEISILKENYKVQTANQLAFLKEQAAIAREIGVKENSLETFRGTAANSIGISVVSELPFYLRGYKAIEKEISLIRGRDDAAIENYIKELPKLLTEMQRLQRDRRVEEVDEALKLTPLSNPPLNAVVFDLSLIEYKSQKKASLILVMAFVLGGMAGVFFVWIRKGYKNYQLRSRI